VSTIAFSSNSRIAGRFEHGPFDDGAGMGGWLSNMPWEQPLNQILQSVEVRSRRSLRHHHRRDRAHARVRRSSGGFRRLVQIVFGLSIAFAASSFFLSFFSFGGGVVI
jgi:type IV secretion system protein VirB2